MRLRNIPGAGEAIVRHAAVFDEAAALSLKGEWRRQFACEQPLHLEIGMGRGRFILRSAIAGEQINFLGLELREEMILQTLERTPQLPENLRLLWLNAARLEEVFAPGEIECIYLNFPDPWPKSRHAKRRLTAPSFLRQYAHILAENGELRFKTDNGDLFHWSAANFREERWDISELDENLAAERSGIITEYESRYRRRGQQIYFLAARPPQR